MTKAMEMQRWARVTGLAALLLPVVLTGCGVGPGVQAGPVAGTALSGKLYGGQQPVSGATLQLYAAGASYGGAATALLSPAVTSGPDGSFNITGRYTCPTGATDVFLTATGGNAGYNNNPNLAMMAALGPCGNLSSSTFILMNEVTTVGSVWALAPFMTGATQIGAPASNAVGLANAFADVNTLVNTAAGSSPGGGLAGGTSVPASEINTLANILAACINSSGGTAGDHSSCGNLFAAAQPGANAPTDTLTAAMNIAQNPALNVASLYALASPTAPFQPSLSSQPANWTVAVKFSGVANSPSALAVDATGNIWVANAGNNTVTELAPNGAVLSGNGFQASFNAPSAIAVDSAGGVWVTNKGNNTVSRLTSSGSPMAGSPYSGGGLNAPMAISFDGLGNAWIANAGSVSELSSAGTAISPAGGYTGNGISAPIGIAVSSH